MSFLNTELENKTVEISLFNIKCAIREHLNRYKYINDNTENVIDMEFGDIRTESDGNEIVPIKLIYMNRGGEPQVTNGQDKS